MGLRKNRFALVFTCALTAFQAQAADDLVRQGADLIKAGKGKAAYELLEPQEEARAGDKDFDLLFGIAALDVGQNTRAIFALERVLAVEPGNVRARAEIGRAYLALGETQAAKGEFQNAKKMGVPPEVEQTIDRFLSAVDRVENAGKTVVRGYVEGTIGYDTNVNAGPARGGIAVPAFGNAVFVLDPGSQATEDWFASIGGGINFSVPVDAQMAIVGGVSGSQRWNQDVSTMDLRNVDANIGSSYTDGKDVFSLALQANTIVVDNNGYRDAVGYSAQW
ncbi:MAG TPA: tetratricopeptide repeat protein, partial [Rhodocyclaceae bacterium]|nr:tetratricopeptide repeat protein [Rhodocyclaceae bacterium]